MEFQKFPKIPRMKRDIIITEKIDGTNAQIVIDYFHAWDGYPNLPLCVSDDGEFGMWVGSRNRWISKNSDNFGFANWALENKEELFKLGKGRHFGEWWGSGIQRGYDLSKGEKRLSLFNTHRWYAVPEEYRPNCVGVVPTLYEGPWSDKAIQVQLDCLKEFGSFAAPGFMDPEGVVVFHKASNTLFKILLKNDHLPKGVTT
jgi:hypothetical protein